MKYLTKLGIVYKINMYEPNFIVELNTFRNNDLRAVLPSFQKLISYI